MITTTDLPGDRPRRILLIVDSEADRRWLRSRLTSDTVHVREARSGRQGLELCRNDPHDLILLDLGLPLGDGFDVLHALKEDSRTSGVPVIVVSTTTGTADVVRGLDGGAVDYVTRPYDPVVLQARIRVALRTKRLQDMLEQRAHVDGLTGLANRHALEERLANDWGLLHRHGGSLAVWVADLDHFKRVNDRHGHAAGDEVLRRAAALLRTSVRTTDMAARYGGEEFVVIAPQCPLKGALKTAERFRDRLASTPILLDHGVALTVTVSVGVASAPEETIDSPSALLALADHALYQAKGQGRNKVLSLIMPEPEAPPQSGWVLTRARA